MSAQAVSSSEFELLDTANDRFKRSFGSWFWGSIIAATVLHFMVFFFFPDLTAEDISTVSREFEAIELPPEIEIPPPPQQISRPAVPVISSAIIDEDITIADVTFEANPIENLPPPPAEGDFDISSQPTFTPYTVAPQLRNTPEVQRALEREYPPILRDAGIGGQVLVHFFINEEGIVQDTRIAQTSGHQALDQAALRVAGVFRFSPALNLDKYVPVWIALPITFQSR
jgi:periplasmic protein TonB